MEFQVNSFHTVGVSLLTKTSKKNNSKVIKQYVFYKLQFYAVRFIYLKSFLLIPVVVSELCPGKGKSCFRPNSEWTSNGIKMLGQEIIYKVNFLVFLTSIQHTNEDKITNILFTMYTENNKFIIQIVWENNNINIIVFILQKHQYFTKLTKCIKS